MNEPAMVLRYLVDYIPHLLAIGSLFDIHF